MPSGHLRKTNVFEVYQNTFHYAQLMRDYREQTCVIIVSYVQISECSYLILFTLIEVTFHCRSFHCLLHCPLAVILELWKTDACLVANCPNNRINTPTLTFLVFSRNKQRNQVNMLVITQIFEKVICSILFYYMSHVTECRMPCKIRKGFWLPHLN